MRIPTTVARITDPKMMFVTCLAATSDGLLWFTNYSTVDPSIGCLDTNGVISWYGDPGDIRVPMAITIGPDGRPWFVYDDGIGRVEADGTVVKFLENDFPGSSGNSITATSDAIWFTWGEDRLGRIIALTGQSDWFTVERGIQTVVTGADDQVWFTDGTALSQITRDAILTAFPLPDSFSLCLNLCAGANQDIWALLQGPYPGQPGPPPPEAIGRFDILSRNWSVELLPPEVGWAYTSTNNVSGSLFPRAVMTTGPDGSVWWGATQWETSQAVARVTPGGDIIGYMVDTGDTPVCVALANGAVFYNTYDDQCIFRLDEGMSALLEIARQIDLFRPILPPWPGPSGRSDVDAQLRNVRETADRISFLAGQLLGEKASGPGRTSRSR
jgi:streptogramin lyase